MSILQVKYIYSERKLNNFLKKLFVDGSKLYAIQYLPATDTEFTNERSTMKVDPVAIVQYWVEVEG